MNLKNKKKIKTFLRALGVTESTFRTNRSTIRQTGTVNYKQNKESHEINKLT